MILPAKLTYTDYEKRRVDLVYIFIHEEYVPFPVLSHDDMLDGLARILDEDMRTEFPMSAPPFDHSAGNYPTEWAG